MMFTTTDGKQWPGPCFDGRCAYCGDKHGVTGDWCPRVVSKTYDGQGNLKSVQFINDYGTKVSKP